MCFLIELLIGQVLCKCRMIIVRFLFIFIVGFINTNNLENKMTFSCWIKKLACLTICLVSCSAWADHVDAGRMHVQIANYTNSSCQLAQQMVINGKLISAPPQALMINDSKTFDVYQAIMGPDVILGYRCGEKTIRFDIQQDLVIMMGHKPHLTVLETTGLRAESTSASSSIIWDSPGMINIALYG
jgi:hypothetical protein